MLRRGLKPRPSSPPRGEGCSPPEGFLPVPGPCNLASQAKIQDSSVTPLRYENIRRLDVTGDAFGVRRLQPSRNLNRQIEQLVDLLGAAPFPATRNSDEPRVSSFHFPVSRFQCAVAVSARPSLLTTQNLELSSADCNGKGESQKR